MSPSVRVKKSRFFYASLDGDPVELPVPPPPRQRSRSVIEIFSRPPLQSSPNFSTQGGRHRSNTDAVHPGSQRLSRVSQHIMSTSTWRSRDALLLEHERNSFPTHEPDRHASSLRAQRSRSTATNDDRQHGRVDDAISIALSSSDHYQDEPDDHDEAVVDHLDVIGK